MGKCANQECGVFTLAVYCKSCSEKNKAVKTAETAAEAALIHDVLFSLETEHAAIKELSNSEDKFSEDYLLGIEHAILTIRNFYAPETLSKDHEE